MNILLISPYLYQKKGPIVWANQFVSEIKNIEGVDLFVLTFSESDSIGLFEKTFTVRGTSFEKRFFKYPFLSLFFNIIKIQKKYKIDIVQTNDEIIAFFSIIARFFTGVPVVLRCGGLYLIEISSYAEVASRQIFGKQVPFFSKIITLFLMLIGKYTMKNVNRVIVLNHYLQKHLSGYRIRSCIIPNAISSEFLFSNDRISNTHIKEQYILTISNMSVPDKVKGLKILINSIYSVTKKFPELKLWIAGEGYYRKELEKLVRKLALSNNIMFLGQRNDIQYLLTNCMFYVHSTLQDVFPNAILEAMASRTPVLATKNGGIPEIIIDRYNGLLCEAEQNSLTENIEILISDNALRQNIAQHGLDMVKKNFSWQTIIELYVKEYRAIIKSHSKSEKMNN